MNVALKMYDARAHGAKCDECPLSKRKNAGPVGPTAHASPRFVLIGEAPGGNEIREGVPFIGRSGRFIDDIMRENRLSRRDAHITNAMLCQPPEDAPEDVKRRAAACCAPRLAKEIAAIDKRSAIVPLGKWAAMVTLGQKQILKTRGFVWKPEAIDDKKIVALRRQATKTRIARKKIVYEDNARLLEVRQVFAGRTVFPSVHPAFILRGADGWRPPLRRDFARLALWLREPNALKLLDEQPYKVASTAKALKQYLSKLDETVGLDIETDGTDPLRCSIDSVAMSDGEHTVVAYPWRKPMARVLTAFLKNRTAIMQNGLAFDEIALKRVNVKIKKRDDTLIGHHTYAGHLPQRLDHIASMFCDVGPWKITAKAGGGDSSTAEKGFAPGKRLNDCNRCGVCDNCKLFTRYNATDALVQVTAWHGMQADLESERRIYDIDMAGASLCQRMQEAGILVDTQRRNELAVRLRETMRVKLREMQRLCGKSFSPNRPAEVRKALYGKFHAPILKLTTKGYRSTAGSVLEELRTLETRGGQLAKHIIDWREASKLLSTFIEGITLGVDGRVHPSWRSFGTVSGRYACRAPNLMNLPRNPEVDIRSMYVPAPGCVFVYFDLSQAEARLAAYCSGDRKYIAAIESGDPYLEIAKVLFDFALHLFEADKKNLDEKDARMRKSLRQIAKKTMLAAQYWVAPINLLPKLLADPDLRGMTGFLTLERVEAACDIIHSTYREYFAYVDDNLASIRRIGHFRDEVGGRIRWLGFYPKITEVANSRIQQGIASAMNQRLVQLERETLALKPVRVARNVSRGVSCIAQVHDSATFEVPEKHVDSVKKLIKDTWAAPIVLSNGRSFVMPTEIAVGTSWSDKDMKKEAA